MNSPELLPAFLKLARRRVVLVGGGSVAASKLESLLKAEAEVSVVAPRIDARIRQAKVTLVNRPFSPSDLDGAWFAVAAAPPEVNREVSEAAEKRRVFVNAVDDPKSASAFFGGVFRRGPLTVAVSTGGQAPALAGLMREALEAVVPEDVEAWVKVAQALRREQRALGVPLASRRPLLLRALNELYLAKDESFASAIGGGS